MAPGTVASALDVDRHLRLERVLALARIAMALLALVVLQLEPVGGAHAFRLADLVSAYTAYASVLALIALLPVRNVDAWRAGVHVVDVLWALVVTSFSDGPVSIFFVFFIFVVVGAAYRWGLRETLFTGAVAAVMLAAEALVPLTGVRWSPGQLAHIVTRSAYVLGLAFLIGYLAEEQNREGRLEALTAQMLASVVPGTGFRASLAQVLSILADAFAATRATLVVDNRATGFVYMWTWTGRQGPLQMTAGSAGDRDVWFCPLPPEPGVWLLVNRARGPALAGVPAEMRQGLPAPEVLARVMQSSRRVLVGDIELGQEWGARLLLYNPGRLRDERGRRWLAAALRRVAPALYSAYLLGRLRERATSAERARIARELHDGLIQSLVGLEMRVDVLKRQPGPPPPVTTELGEIQAILREQAVATRELMQDIRPVDTDGTDVPALLASLAERFRRDTGIDARFACDLEDPVVPPRLARELVRVAQEALVNARRHSGATQVVLDFGATAEAWLLNIDDNGRGFNVDGRFSMDELDRDRRGPLVIKQRVRAMGGTLTLISSPGRGARIEVMVPRRTR